MRCLAFALGLLLASPAWADMYQDASNAKLPEAQDNLAIPRSVEAYGAKCDGVTDDTAAIQAAINANQTSVAGTTVKELTIPAGTCITGTLTIAGQLNLAGQGAQAGSRLVLKALTATPLIVVQTAGTYSTLGDPRITIRDLQLLAAGNTHSGPGVGTSHGIDFRPGSYRISVELNHVAIWNFGGMGLNHAGGWLGAVLALNVQIFANQNGVYNNSGSDWSFNNVQIYNNLIDGIQYSGSGYAFFNSVGVYTNGGHGLNIYGNTASNVWIGGSIDRNGKNGIYYNRVTQPWLFVGPQFVFNNASGGFSDIQIDGVEATAPITLVSPNMQSTFSGADYNIKYTNGAIAPVVISGSAAGIAPGVSHANFTNLKSAIRLPTSAMGAYDARDYGACTWDATHDVGPCINAAITAALANTTALGGGGKVVIPAGEFGLSTTIAQTANKKGIAIEGAGGEGSYGICKTSLKWIGAAAGTMVQIEAPIDTVVGPGLSGICFNGNGLAGTGIKLRSVNSGLFSGTYVSDVTSRAWDIDIGVGVGNSDNTFLDNNIGLSHAASINADGWWIGPGSLTVNTHHNYWHKTHVQHRNGRGMVVGNTDSNIVYGFFAQAISGGTGKSLELLASAAGILGTARSNRFYWAEPQGGTLARGTPTAAYPSVNNVLDLNTESGAPYPVIEAGATLFCATNDASNCGTGANNLVVRNSGFFGSRDTGGTLRSLIQLYNDDTTRLDGGLNGLLLRTNNGGINVGAVDGLGIWRWLFPVKLYGTTVASLPVCNAGLKYGMAAVSDALAPAYNATIAGGGAVSVPVMCDGALWKAR